METQEGMEREINLMELFWQILLGWRQIICFAAIFAILLGGAKYTRDMVTYRANQNTDEKKMEDALTEEELQQVDTARALIARLKEYYDYQKNSIWMQINPYKEPIIELQYYVKSDYIINYTRDNSRDYTSNIVAMYYNYLLSGELKQKIIENANLSIHKEDLGELIKIPREKEERTENIEGTILSIAIAYPDENKLKEISESIKTQLNEKEIEFQQIGSHKLIFMEESQNVIVDQTLVERKRTIAKDITDCNTQLTNLKDDMTEQQLQLLENDQKKHSARDTQIMLPEPKISIKYILLGAILGIFFVCMWITCKLLFTAKLQNSEEIRNLYNIRLLGEITVSTNKKRFLSLIDKKLLEIKNRKKKKLSLEQQIKIVSVNIALSCKQKKIDCIYMTGSEYEKIDVRILDKLRRELDTQDIQVKEGGNIFYDAESLKQGTEIGTMFFIEQKAESIYDEISNELNLAKEQNNTILGIVVLI